MRANKFTDKSETRQINQSLNPSGNGSPCGTGMGDSGAWGLRGEGLGAGWLVVVVVVMLSRTKA